MPGKRVGNLRETLGTRLENKVIKYGEITWPTLRTFPSPPTPLPAMALQKSNTGAKVLGAPRDEGHFRAGLGVDNSDGTSEALLPGYRPLCLTYLRQYNLELRHVSLPLWIHHRPVWFIGPTYYELIKKIRKHL